MLRLAMTIALAVPVYAQFSNISGTVLPPSGNTIIRAAKVRLEEVASRPNADHERFTSDQEVDASGSFSFPRIRAGQYRLIGKYANPSYMPGCSGVKVPPDRAKVTLVLQNPATHDFRKQFVDKTGKPMVGLRVSIVPKCPDWEASENYQTTDGGGYADFHKVRLAEDLLFTVRYEKSAPDNGSASGSVAGYVSTWGPSSVTSDIFEEAAQTTGNSGVVQKTISADGVVQEAQSSPFHPRTDTVDPSVWQVDLENGTLLPLGLTLSDKLKLHLKRSVDPSSFVFAALVAAVNQARDDPREWGGGMQGFGERAASAYGYYTAVRTAFEIPIDASLHLDPRYFRSTTKGAWPRLKHCFAQTFITRTDRGTETFNFWRFGSAYAAGFLSNAWVPPSIRTKQRAIIRANVSIGLDTAANVLKEFLPELQRTLHLSKPK